MEERQRHVCPKIYECFVLLEWISGIQVYSYNRKLAKGISFGPWLYGCEC